MVALLCQLVQGRPVQPDLHQTTHARLLCCCTQVESVAVAKHGSLDAVSQQKQQKVKDKIEERARKRKTAEHTDQTEAARHQHLTAVLRKYSLEVPVQEGEHLAQRVRAVLWRADITRLHDVHHTHTL